MATEHDIAESVGGDPAGHPVGLDGTRVDIKEKPAWAINGGLGLLLCLVLIFGGIALATVGISHASNNAGGGGMIFGGTVAFILGLLWSSAFAIVSPGDTMVLSFFGSYIGTVRKAGLHMIIPFAGRKKVSVKVHNFETNELKVNDADGNPVNIAAIIVWQVADTAKSVFAVEDFSEFVAVQSEAALRHVATAHPYDNPAPGEESLRGSTELVARELAHEVADRIAIAGLEVIEARISSLAYAPEIAQAMLQRQQASAVIAAREQIVEGAVSMVRSALAQLENDIVTLDEERKAAMISNLLVVLCSDSRATPVVNTGSLYS
ncbi:hypothetical protein HMPREF1531_00133 [Propionibacterium sp. oral taxon 192 str. F0372]|uniref:SPFH domain-containing protein n=1 Tax=Propionibacterium sp. oral taxon 192 TaxID=671222 RepID=UPI0003528138|nr:SPFH domain-containing protein [Propionibacterium sp. oral taxon 192]EPH07084.1 hypothetical protein HMPREF1531_00133 [Propionibacterium sp. oral taxon 192 str. F0372]